MFEPCVKVKKQYVPPKDLKAEYFKSLEADKATDKLILMFQKIAKHYATRFKYVNKCDESACVSYATSEAWIKWKKYDEEKSSNIFSFYTSMIANDLMFYHKKMTKGNKNQISIESLFSNENK